MKKKLLTMMTVIALAFSVIACGNSEEAVNSNLTGEFAFDIPEGFTESETPNNYVSPNYPNEVSNVNWLVLENDGSFDSISGNLLMSSIESEIESTYGADVTLKLLNEEFYEIDGHRAFKYTIEYEIAGSKVVQLQCIIENADKLYFLTFTEINDEGYYDAFVESAKTVRFE